VKKFFIFLFVIAGVLVRAPAASAQTPLTINLVAVNAKDEAKQTDVKYYLPRELTPADILDPGELKVDYDVDKAQYFVYGTFSFKAKESRTFKVRVKDVWRVTDQEIDVMKTQLNENFSFIDKNTKNYDEILAAKNKISDQLDFILAQQKTYSKDIGRRIEEYRAYKKMLDQVRTNAYNLDFLKEEGLEMATKSRVGTVRLTIQVTNPEDQEKTIQHKHYLPEEVRAEQVLDKQGLDIRYDEKKGKSYLVKEESFKPHETKKYEIVLKDIWVFPLTKVDVIEQRAKTSYEELKDSMYADSGKFLFDSIMEKLTAIRDSSKEDLPVAQHIGMDRINERRYAEAKNDLDRLEQMTAVVRAKKLEQMEHNKVKNVLDRLKALRGLQSLSQALFKKGISVTVTWRIIFGTMAFIGLFTGYHFFLWSKRSKTMGEDLGPPPGEGIKTVPKPGEGEEDEEDG